MRSHRYKKVVQLGGHSEAGNSAPLGHECCEAVCFYSVACKKGAKSCQGLQQFLVVIAMDLILLRFHFEDLGMAIVLVS